MIREREQKVEEARRAARPAKQPAAVVERPAEVGGPKGPEPTRYGDWERAGRCVDF
ncbi:MAG TPA: succinate dehydrogenase assembly factor 4 [Gammaproteobacteria bacterium]